MMPRRLGGGDKAYNLKVTRYEYVEEAYDPQVWGHATPTKVALDFECNRSNIKAPGLYNRRIIMLYRVNNILVQFLFDGGNNHPSLVLEFGKIHDLVH